MQATKNDLLRCKPFGGILRFSIPLIIGDFCQQLYNVVDSIVASNFISTEASAALGAANPIMSVVIFLLIGFAMGGSVIMSRYFGCDDYQKVKHTMSTALVIGVIFTFLLSVLSIGISRPFLALLKTKDEIIGDSDVYLKIVFAGAIFTYLYNFYCFGIRAIGDSFTPLVFLFVSVFVNLILDILFVVVFKWGIEGTAIATVIAQAFSAILCILYTNKKYELLKLKIKELRIDKKIVGEITSYSVSMAIQQVFVYVGRIAIQGLVNTYSINAMAGINNATRLDNLMQTPMRGYVNALTTYTAQNYGAKRYDRVIQGYKVSWIFICIYTLIFTSISILFAEQFLMLFDKNQEVIQVGSGYLIAISSGYILMSIIVQSQGVFKAIGLLKTFVVSTMLTIIFRISLSYLFDHIWGIDGMYWAPTVSWIIGSIYCITCMTIAYHKKLKPLAKTTNICQEDNSRHIA